MSKRQTDEEIAARLPLIEAEIQRIDADIAHAIARGDSAEDLKLLRAARHRQSSLRWVCRHIDEVRTYQTAYAHDYRRRGRATMKLAREGGGIGPRQEAPAAPREPLRLQGLAPRRGGLVRQGAREAARCSKCGAAHGFIRDEDGVSCIICGHRVYVVAGSMRREA